MNSELDDKNIILKQLNQELTDTNDLLKEKLNTRGKIEAEIVSNAEPKTKCVPKIVIRKTNKEETMKNMEPKGRKRRFIDYSLFKSSELQNSCKVQKEQILNPNVRVTGINNIEQLDNNAEDINLRNIMNFDNKCRLLHSYANQKTTLQSIILEITAVMHENIKENNRIVVGYQNCKVFDIINVAPCLKCGRNGHNKLKCRNALEIIKQ